MRATPHFHSRREAPRASRATVVNIRCGEPYDVYIGRPGKGERGPWGNPFRLHDVGGRARSIALYRRWLWQQIRADAITPEQLAALHGKRLGCFCAPQACHGDVLADAAAWAYAQLHRAAA